MRRRISIVVFAAIAVAFSAVAQAQQPISRLKGRVTSERGEALADAEVRVEAFFGPAAGTFAGQRTLAARTNAKGEWSVLGISPGIWLFEVLAPGYLPETVALPVRLITPSGPAAAGMMFTWQLILKPMAAPVEGHWQPLADAVESARGGNVEEAAALLRRVPEDANPDYLAAAGRVSLLVRDTDMARAYFARALEADPTSYRAALGVASTVLLQRDFDLASRAFDAARNRTRDKDEQRFISAAIGDLATIKNR